MPAAERKLIALTALVASGIYGAAVLLLADGQTVDLDRAVVLLALAVPCAVGAWMAVRDGRGPRGVALAALAGVMAAIAAVGVLALASLAVQALVSQTP